VTSIRSATTSSSSRSTSQPLTADAPIAALAGAGPVTAGRLAERGLHRIRDLLYFFPTAYDDYRRAFAVAELAGLPEGTAVVVRGKVVRVRRFFRRLLDVYIEEGGAALRARWFRPNAGMAKAYEKGKQVALAGKLRRNDKGESELIHPSNVTARQGKSAALAFVRAIRASRACPAVPSRKSLLLWPITRRARRRERFCTATVRIANPLRIPVLNERPDRSAVNA